MKVKALMAVAALVPGMLLMQANGGTAVAVVNFQRAVEETPDGKSAISKLTTFTTEQQTAISLKLKEAQDLENRIRTQDSVRSDAARAQMTRDLDAAKTNIETMQQDAQNKFDQMQEQLLRPVQLRTNAAIRSYAMEHGFKIVLDASVLQDGLFYVHDTADITSEIIRRIATDLNNPGEKSASLAETPQEQIIHRTWSGANFLQQAPVSVPVFPILSPVKLTRNVN
ncbi:MAG TPA: OmpH family outer membrane protein [Terriglobia bacterium]|nr:OmpH family outer membrane protein [Terriglobia bacterium]